ncbi:hypothetical protein VUR80DRAFT_8968 [Thermomyces stellatus]
MKPLGDNVPRGTVYSENSSTDTFDSALDFDDEPSDGGYRENPRIPALPVYRKAILGPAVQPSNYRVFPELFPSLDKMFVRHDEFTSDGNMNLRVDTQLRHHPQRMVQLFHLRMYDLDARIFSLRRYCRDSGREVCRSKREYSTGSSDGRQALQRSVSSVFRSLGGRPQCRRQGSSSTLFSLKSGHSDKRPDSSLSMRSRKNDDQFSASPCHKHEARSREIPTNTIKLMFTNYASVEVVRRGGGPVPKRYDFEWWGRRYSWKRSYNENLNITSFHLVCDGRHDLFLANIIPEARSPHELESDEVDGGWMPPSMMWFSRELEATLAELFVATGLIALVDDCIRDRWEEKKVKRLSSLRV